MNISLTIRRRSLTGNILVTAAAVLTAVLLPQVFHTIGIISGTGASVGAAFLPMHLPVLATGFVCGPVVGLIAGILSPIISFCISGMPTAALVPFITLELAVYGLTSGLLSRTSLNGFVQLLLTQIAGRAARAAAMLAVMAVSGTLETGLAAIPAFITAGLFGIVLQWMCIPSLMAYFNRRNEDSHA